LAEDEQSDDFDANEDVQADDRKKKKRSILEYHP
jgi:hypothetical protein